MYFNQGEYEIRWEWGIAGLRELTPQSDAVVIVDVLSFSTAVDIAVGNGASVYPYQFHGDSAEAYARTLGALCAESQRGS